MDVCMYVVHARTYACMQVAMQVGMHVPLHDYACVLLQSAAAFWCL